MYVGMLASARRTFGSVCRWTFTSARSPGTSLESFLKSARAFNRLIAPDGSQPLNAAWAAAVTSAAVGSAATAGHRSVPSSVLLASISCMSRTAATSSA
jgi:hypothetical protein